MKLALTCGEETGGAFNGANWLVTEHKDWIDAQFALNEGSVGLRDASGKKLSLGIQAGEKVYQDFRIEASNPGGTAVARVRITPFTAWPRLLFASVNMSFP